MKKILLTIWQFPWSILAWVGIILVFIAVFFGAGPRQARLWLDMFV